MHTCFHQVHTWPSHPPCFIFPSLPFQRYSNHDIVRFLEKVGAAFGACQNAYTSADETVYQLLVPSNNEGLLSDTLSVLAEFAGGIR